MGFILEGLDSESYDRNYSDRQIVKRIIDYFRPHTKKVIAVSATLTLNSLAQAASPIIIATAIDMVAANPTTLVMLVFAFSIVGLGGLGWLFNYIRQMITAKVIGDVVLKLRSDVFEKTISHDMSFYDKHPSGKIVSRITSDTQDFSNIVALVIDLLSQFLMVALLTIWVFSINIWLALLLLGMAPIAIFIALSFRRLARKVSRESKRVNAKINAQIQESISGIMVAKSFRQEQAVYNNFLKNNKQSYRVGIRRGLVFNLIFPVIGIASGIGTAVVVYFGGVAVLAGHLSPGSWYLFMQVVGFFWWPLLNIASFWSQFQDGLSASERVFALIDAEPAVKQKEKIALNRLKGKLEFEKVYFSYKSDESVLKDFSLTIEPGETIALVGHTGAGKSSIAKLVTRFYEFQKGQLLIDGNDIRCFKLDQYRTQVGFVPQDPFLFSGTVAENIGYGKPTATKKEILYAATHLGRGDWLQDLPDGINTDVGSRGASISFGQRQLVALARVLLKDPAIFVLDEATASVDPFTEVQIQEGLTTVMVNRTAIVIAHRLSTVKNAGRIIVLKSGKIIEQGTHQTLLKNKGHYAELYNTYFRHQSLEYIERTASAAKIT